MTRNDNTDKRSINLWNENIPSELKLEPCVSNSTWSVNVKGEIEFKLGTRSNLL